MGVTNWRGIARICAVFVATCFVVFGAVPASAQTFQRDPTIANGEQEYVHGLHDLLATQAKAHHQHIFLDPEVMAGAPEVSGWDDLPGASSYFRQNIRVTGYLRGRNAWGARYSVPPFGEYSGDGLILESATVLAGKEVGRTLFPVHHFAGGWMFEPHGLLAQQWHVLQESVVTNGSTSSVTCYVARRFAYYSRNTTRDFQPAGKESVCQFSTAGSTPDPQLCIDNAWGACGPMTDILWSNDGQVLLDATQQTPVLHYPDGSIEIMVSGVATAPFLTPFDGFPHETFFGTTQTIDRNGNATHYVYDASGYVTSTFDALGRTTTYVRDQTSHLVTEIDVPGPGTRTLPYKLTWSPISFDTAVLFPDVVCTDSSGLATPCTSYDHTGTVTTLTGMLLPDGRSYQFSYDYPVGSKQYLWGALTEVITPDGAVVDYGYGDHTTPSHLRPKPSLSVLPEGGMPGVFERSLMTTTTYPNGKGAPGSTVTIDLDTIQTITAATAGVIV
jgi:YD repeat-containing protein